MTEPTDESTRSGVRTSIGRRQRLGARLRKGSLFATGVLAALLAVVVYGWLFPAPRPLNQGDVDQRITQALASQTPAPPFSEAVYQAVQPSLVLIQTQSTDAQGKATG